MADNHDEKKRQACFVNGQFDSIEPGKLMQYFRYKLGDFTFPECHDTTILDEMIYVDNMDSFFAEARATCGVAGKKVFVVKAALARCLGYSGLLATQQFVVDDYIVYRDSVTEAVRRQYVGTQTMHIYGMVKVSAYSRSAKKRKRLLGGAVSCGREADAAEAPFGDGKHTISENSIVVIGLSETHFRNSMKKVLDASKLVPGVSDLF